MTRVRAVPSSVRGFGGLHAGEDEGCYVAAAAAAKDYGFGDGDD